MSRSESSLNQLNSFSKGGIGGDGVKIKAAAEAA